MKQSVQVSILGQQFNLKTDAPPEKVHSVARFAEEQIAKVAAGGGTVDSLQSAILALLNVSAMHLEANVAAGGGDESRARVEHLVAKIESALG